MGEGGPWGEGIEQGFNRQRSGAGQGPGKEDRKVLVLVGVFGVLRGGYDHLQCACPGLCFQLRDRAVPGQREISMWNPWPPFWWH